MKSSQFQGIQGTLLQRLGDLRGVVATTAQDTVPINSSKLQSHPDNTKEHKGSQTSEGQPSLKIH